jgi:predicted metal-dependent phosphoesterase TrpH
MTIDLHTHTYFSDGRPSPRVLLHAAVEQGVDVLAISDHDNARGYRQAKPLAAGLGIRLIPAVELTTHWPECHARPGALEVDVLGYFIDPESPAFIAVEQAGIADIAYRIDCWRQALDRGGYPLKLTDVRKQNPRLPTTIALLAAMQERGYATSIQAALAVADHYVEAVSPPALTIDKAIQSIHAAGGVAVLAHPVTVSWRGGLLDQDAVRSLVDYGLDGLEIYHHRLDQATREHFLNIARHFNLAVSGGSDEHGWMDQFDRLGKQPVTPEILAELERRAGLYQHKQE